MYPVTGRFQRRDDARSDFRQLAALRIGDDEDVFQDDDKREESGILAKAFMAFAEPEHPFSSRPDLGISPIVGYHSAFPQPVFP